MSEEIFKKKEFVKTKLQPSDVRLRTASGNFMKVLGECQTELKIGNQKFHQRFIVVDHLRSSVILGRDFLCKHHVDISLAERKIVIGNKHIVPLSQFHEVSNIVRLVNDIEIPPHHVVSCFGKYQRKFDIENGTPVQWSQSTDSFLNNEPGLSILNGLGEANSKRRIPISFVNETSKYFKLKKGNVVARVEALDQEINVNEVVSVVEPINEKSENLKLDRSSYPLLTDEQFWQLQNLLTENHDVFAKHSWDLGKTNLITGHIDTGNHPPVRMKPYRTPIAYREEVSKQIDSMLKAGIISPSNSSYAAPLLCVPKKDGSIRICYDYRKLNATVSDFYWPLPQVDDILASIGNSKYFSCLDFLKGYLQIPLDETKHKSSFICHKGSYMSEVLPFGLSTSPSIFQQCMSKLLNGHQNAIAYLDDIICHSSSFSDHVLHLSDIFCRIRKANMKLRFSKCEFLKDEVLYLGHVVSAKGIRPDPEKVKVIRDLSPPKTVKMVRSFIGMASFYRRYIKDFAKLAQPLTELTRKNVHFSWTEQRQKSWEALKVALSTAPILKLPELGKPFALFTDSSDFAIGGVLCQLEDDVYKPVYYLSHQLSKSQKKWAILEKEAYSIIFCIERFRFLLEGSGKFDIFCDHKPLSFKDSAENKNAKLQRWAAKISSFGGQIRYIQGNKNVKADFLSRLDPEDIPKSATCDKIAKELDEDCVCVINTDQLPNNADDAWTDTGEDDDPAIRKPCIPHNLDIEAEQIKDQKLSAIRNHLITHGTKSKFHKQYVLRDNVLFFVDRDENLRLEIPKNLVNQLIKETHEGFMGAHLARDKTWETLHLRYHWKGMTSDVYDFIQGCVKCKQQNAQGNSVPLQDVDRPNYPFQHIAIDTAGYYLTSERGNRYCLTVSDLFSGWVECFALPDKSASSIARTLVEEIFRRFSWPRKITSDNGSEFCNEILAQLTKLGHVHHIKSTPYNPRSNGRAERAHRTMVSCLAKVDKKADWDLYLPSFCAAYNTSVAANTKYSPFYLVFHRDPQLPLDTLLKPREIYYGDEYLPQALERMHVAQHHVKERLEKQFNRNKTYQDSKRNAKHIEFQPGDPVYIRNHARKDKLDAKWLPYHRIIEKLGEYSYHVQNQVNGKTKRVHAKDLSLAQNIDQWKQDNVRTGRQSRYVIRDDNPDSESEPSGEEASADDNDNDQSISLEDGDENTTQNKDPPRPGRQAKKWASEKIKVMRQIESSDIESSIASIIEDKISKAFHLLADGLQTRQTDRQ